MLRFFAGLGLLLALAVIILHGGKFWLACLGENNTCAESASELASYEGRLFDPEGRPLAHRKFGVYFRSFETREGWPIFYFRTDSHGRFCIRAPRGDSSSIFIEPGRSSLPVDARFRDPQVLAEANRNQPDDEPLPILVVPLLILNPQTVQYRGSEQGANSALSELWIAEDAPERCDELEERAPWWRYTDRWGDWRATTPLLLALSAFLVRTVAALSRARGRARSAMVGVGAACSYIAFILYLIVR